MKFYDRTKELALFADIYTKSQQEAQMTVLVGRRHCSLVPIVSSIYELSIQMCSKKFYMTSILTIQQATCLLSIR